MKQQPAMFYPLPLFLPGDMVKSKSNPELGLMKVTYAEPYGEAHSIGSVPIITVMVPYTGQDDDDASDLVLVARPAVPEIFYPDLPQEGE